MKPKFGRDHVELAVLVGEVLDVADVEADREPGRLGVLARLLERSARQLSIAVTSAPARAARSATEPAARAEVEPALARARREPLDELVVDRLEHRRQALVHPFAPEIHRRTARRHAGAY